VNCDISLRSLLNAHTNVS